MLFTPFSLIPRISAKARGRQDKRIKTGGTHLDVSNLVVKSGQVTLWTCFLLPNPQNILKLPHKQGVVYPLRKMTIRSKAVYIGVAQLDER